METYFCRTEFIFAKRFLITWRKICRGWCTEVSYAALDRGIFVNRGFLNGPYCPIYGCGVVIVVAVLTPLKDNLLILFIGSFLLTSILEYITGYLLEKVFHNQWWDYSDKPFNIHGYVCLKFSIYWHVLSSWMCCTRSFIKVSHWCRILSEWF